MQSCVSALQESLAAAGIHPGSRASAQNYIAAIKQGCGVEPQLACHYRTADLQEVSCCAAQLQTVKFGYVHQNCEYCGPVTQCIHAQVAPCSQ